VRPLSLSFIINFCRSKPLITSKRMVFKRFDINKLIGWLSKAAKVYAIVSGVENTYRLLTKTL